MFYFGPDGVSGVGPEGDVVEDGLKTVQDAACGCFVDELYGDVLSAANLVAEVDANGGDEEVFVVCA